MKKYWLIVILSVLLCTVGLTGCFDSDKQNGGTVTPDDKDGDGLSDEQETLLGTNVSNRDSDGDGVYDFFETDNGAAIDTDNDGVNDTLDIDDDGDSIPTADEQPDPDGDENPADACDSDGDGIPDYLDNDDDNDGIHTVVEMAYGATHGYDVDGDDVPNYRDTDSDGDGKTDTEEGTGDVDGDGIPNFLDPDDNDGPLGDLDGDGVTNQKEGYDDPIPPDSDDDGNPDYLDPDTSGGSGVTDDETEKFIGSWHELEDGSKHWIFYVNGSLKTTSIEIDDFTQETYLYTLWSVYEVSANNLICFKDQDVPPEEQPSVCFDYEFFDEGRAVNLLVGGDVVLSLTRD